MINVFILFFSVRLLSVLRGHSVFSSPPQRPMTSDFEGFSIPDVIHYIYFPILILEKEPVFPFLVFSAKQGNYWYHFYNVFGMPRSLTVDGTRDLPHSKPVLNHYGIEAANVFKNRYFIGKQLDYLQLLVLRTSCTGYMSVVIS